MTEITLLIDFYNELEKQGPGSESDTLRALSFIEIANNENLKIVDIGCGNGGQTLVLAKHTQGEITAVDLFPEFLDKLILKSKKVGLDNKICALNKSMDSLPFKKGEFDIIWSEGAIYNMGFKNGVEQWKHFLKKGGYLAVSEITWTTNTRPKIIEDYWLAQYAEIDTAENKVKVLEENGFTSIQYFILPKSSWIDTYYKPMENMFSSFLKRHHFSKSAQNIVDEHKNEIEKYNAYNQYFSYGFYVAKKI